MQFFERIARLEGEHASFAIATVVGRRSPVSSHLGDRALIFADGHMEGFVGGSCSRDIVRRQALRVIRERHPLLLQIRPDADGAEERVAGAERVVIPTSCASEGAVDVYIEPRVPLRQLLVVGFTPVADALASLASTLEYDVIRVVAEDELRDVVAVPGTRVLAVGSLRAFFEELDGGARRALVAIVASQGHYDELALEVLLAFSPAFSGLLASRRRSADVLGVLAQQGVPAERLATIRTPVGLDIGARSPGEVAVSVLAQIIALRLPDGPSDAPPLLAAGLLAVDPVCGMYVETAGALHRFEHATQKYFFCGAGCRSTFTSNPAQYLATLGTA